MSSTEEVRRLGEIYRRYHESGLNESRWSVANPGNQAWVREWTRVLDEMLDASGFLPLTGRRILEVGCGSGKVLARLMRWGALPHQLYGIDLMDSRIDEARQRFPGITFAVANAEELEFGDGVFDLVLLSTVLSSILHASMSQNVAREVSRVLRPGGAVVWYDFRYNNPCNPHVRGIKKAVIRALFPDFDLRLRTVTLLPPLARRLGAATPVLYPALARIPFLRTHHLGLLIKPADGAGRR
jgi:SAM-dependent methyltransferase